MDKADAVAIVSWPFCTETTSQFSWSCLVWLPLPPALSSRGPVFKGMETKTAVMVELRVTPEESFQKYKEGWKSTLGSWGVTLKGKLWFVWNWKLFRLCVCVYYIWVAETNRPYYSSLARGRIIEFIPFPRALALWNASSLVRVAVSIFLQWYH